MAAHLLAISTRLFSFFGSELFFVMALPILYWCVDSRLAVRLAIFLLGAGA